MRRRLFMVLTVAALVGGVASYLIFRVVQQTQGRAAPAEAHQNIVVAAANMTLAETITNQHVKLVPWPKAAVPPGALSSLEQAQGRVVRSSIVAGEPLMEAKLAPQLSGRGGLMPMLVGEGSRAVTIKVDDAVRETGFILPNSRVDVLVSMAGLAKDSGEKIAKVILQDVEVLASGQTVELRDNKPVPTTTVTLSLTPDQAERLTLAQTEGRLTLVTRNLKDKQIVQTHGATKETLLADASPPRARATAARGGKGAKVASARGFLPGPSLEGVSVSVLRGGKVTEHHFVRKGEDEWVEQRAAK